MNKNTGTTFRICLHLPRHMTSHGIETGDRNQHIESSFETILIAKDNAEVRAENGEEAVDKFQAYRDTINLVITDVIMPKKNSQEAYREFKSLMSDVRVLFTSGYTSAVINDKGIPASELHFSGKPASPSAIARNMREILSTPALN